MQLRDKDGLTEQEFLAAYRPGDYPRPSVACDMAIFTVTDGEPGSSRRLPEKELRILLIQRGGHPYLGSWALPGGFVRPTETVGQAARRELQEETGVEHVYLEQLGVFSDPGRDPRTWVMSCAHLALISPQQVRAGDDAQQAAWFRLAFQISGDAPGGGTSLSLELTRGETRLSALVEHRPGVSGFWGPEEFSVVENRGLAFDHAKIIACALRRLQGQAETGGIAFHLMPERFTLTQLQQVYEVLLGRPLFKAAFRRKIVPFVAETDQFTENAAHRPSRLYRLKEGVRL